MIKTLIIHIILEECIETIFNKIQLNFNTIISSNYRIKRVDCGDNIRFEIIIFNDKTRKYENIIVGILSMQFVKEHAVETNKSQESIISYYEKLSVNNFLNGARLNSSD